MKTMKNILKKPANEIPESMYLDINSKRIKFIDHLYYLIYNALHGYDLTALCTIFCVFIKGTSY